MYLSQKLHTNSCFANLRAISDLFSFFLYTLYSPSYFVSFYLNINLEHTIIRNSTLYLQVNFLFLYKFLRMTSEGNLSFQKIQEKMSLCALMKGMKTAMPYNNTIIIFYNIDDNMYRSSQTKKSKA